MLCNSGKDAKAGKKPTTKRKGDPKNKPKKITIFMDSPNFPPMRTFTLKWLRGNISACFGCGKEIISTNPKDIIIVYRDEQFMYGAKQLKKLQNVHFHITPSCVTKNTQIF